MTSTTIEKSQDNGHDEIVPMAFVAAPLSPSGEHTYHEAQELAPDMIQVVTVDGPEEGEPEQRSASPLILQQQDPETLLPPQELDPSAIHIVTFDEPPDADNPDFQPMQHSHQQQAEGTPLLQNDGRSQSENVEYNDPYAREADEDISGYGGARCRDVPWAFAFWLHFATVMYLGLCVSPKGYKMMDEMNFDIQQIHDFLQESFVNDDDFTDVDLEMLTAFLKDFQSWWTMYPPRILGFALALVAFAFCLNIAKTLVRNIMVALVSFSLVSPVVVLTFIFILGLAHHPSVWFFLAGTLVIGLFVVFIRKTMWPKIEFAAINLQIALHGIGNNLGTYLLAFFCAKLTLTWILFWCYTTIGLVSYMTATYCPTDHADLDDRLEDGKRFLDSTKIVLDDQSPPCGQALAAVLALLVSFYWTFNFIANTAQVYVAGVMATWCYDKDTARGCFSAAVTSSMYRSVTFSSGPIAFGSLFQGICKMFRSLLSHSNLSHTRENYVVRDIDDCRCCCFGVVGLVLDCLSELVGDVLDYFSQWAYVLVGIYGHSYLESGKEVMDLFRSRGFMALIADRLVVWALSVAVIVHGIVTGLAAILLERLVTSIMHGEDDGGLPPSYIFGPPPEVWFVSFMVGFITGCVVSSVFMYVVGGAVNTLIVCWAKSPTSFMENHKEWADELITIWSSAYPGTEIQPRYDSVTSVSTTLSDQVPGQPSTTYGATNSELL